MEAVVIAIIALAAFAAVMVPLFRRDASAEQREFAAEYAPTIPDALPVANATEDTIEREVLRYRAAVRAGTVCNRCGQANPADARFCYECGNRLPRQAAKEFE